MDAQPLEITNPTHWAGIDVAKRTFDACVLSNELGASPMAAALPGAMVKTFARTEQGARQFVAWLDEQLAGTTHPHAVRVCMEATGNYSSELSGWLLSIRGALAPAIINPKQTAAFAKSLGLRNTTDKLLARALALYGLERRPAPFQPLSRQAAELRSLVRYRHKLVCQRTAEKNRAAETMGSKAVERMQQRRLRQLDKDINKVDQAIKELTDHSPEFASDTKLITSIHGVGTTTTATVLAELGDLRRFARSRQLTAFAGLSTRIVQSGTSVAHQPHMCKQGNARVRHVLYMAALTVIRKPSDLQRTYQRLIQQGKPAKVAIGAVMRKLLCVMRAILIANQPYELFHKQCG